MDEMHRLFFEDLARSLDYWVRETVEAATNAEADVSWSSIERHFRLLQPTLATREQREAFRAVLHKALTGLLHSVMVTLDGGSELADSFTLTITTSTGATLAPGLHEMLYDHLWDTGRIAEGKTNQAPA